jgi:hypothetical protein
MRTDREIILKLEELIDDASFIRQEEGVYSGVVRTIPVTLMVDSLVVDGRVVGGDRQRIGQMYFRVHKRVANALKTQEEAQETVRNQRLEAQWWQRP